MWYGPLPRGMVYLSIKVLLHILKCTNHDIGVE